MQNKLAIISSFGIILTVTILGSVSPFSVYAQVNTYPPDSKPFGKSYGEWSAEWWKWLNGIPADRNPGVDTTGAFCSENQNMSSPVWYLAGTWGSKEVRNCDIPSGKSILISPIEVLCTPAEIPSLKTEEDMRKCAKEDQNKVHFVKVTIDGKDLPDVTKYRFQSPLFNITLPENNVMGIPQGVITGVSEGYFVMLKPLTEGNHIIKSAGSLTDATVQGTQNFASDVTYNIVVK